MYAPGPRVVTAAPQFVHAWFERRAKRIGAPLAAVPPHAAESRPSGAAASARPRARRTLAPATARERTTSGCRSARRGSCSLSDSREAGRVEAASTRADVDDRLLDVVPGLDWRAPGQRHARRPPVGVVLRGDRGRRQRPGAAAVRARREVQAEERLAGVRRLAAGEEGEELAFRADDQVGVVRGTPAGHDGRRRDDLAGEVDGRVEEVVGRAGLPLPDDVEGAVRASRGARCSRSPTAPLPR
jgi:hypothetical protein